MTAILSGPVLVVVMEEDWAVIKEVEEDWAVIKGRGGGGGLGSYQGRGGRGGGGGFGRGGGGGGYGGGGRGQVGGSKWGDFRRPETIQVMTNQFKLSNPDATLNYFLQQKWYKYDVTIFDALLRKKKDAEESFWNRGNMCLCLDKAARVTRKLLTWTTDQIRSAVVSCASFNRDCLVNAKYFG
ncbi:hypothetical protein MHU86_15912 [Fragilaria crotonensis]|nr:hypothetical protein MHU86_15912 [Fragilaria crotonensis]